MNTLGLLVVCLVVTPVMAAVLYANDHPVLFNFISNKEASWIDDTGNNIVDNGDSVSVGEGSFSVEGPSWLKATSDEVYYIDEIYFSLVCSGTLHTCVFDGSGSRTIMTIWGTGGGTMKLSGIHFFNGGDGGDSGGALKIRSSALVSLRGCKLSSNQANYGAGIYAGDTATVNLYSTSFDGNTHTHFSGKGDDIYVSGASATVHSTCPPDWSGTPAAGSDLDTYNEPTSPGTLSGTTKSFDIG